MGGNQTLALILIAVNQLHWRRLPAFDIAFRRFGHRLKAKRRQCLVIITGTRPSLHVPHTPRQSVAHHSDEKFTRFLVVYVREETQMRLRKTGAGSATGLRLPRW